jgi:N-acetylglucosamine-6-phosphate deacetylase
MPLILDNAKIVFPDSICPGGVSLAGDRITACWTAADRSPAGERIDIRGMYLAPGFVDIHVHGGGGSDFMDLTADAFRTVCRTHARHGTTSLTPTSTVADREEYDQFLSLCRELRRSDTGGARVVGAHLYGPYFSPAAKGCHPARDFVTPDASHTQAFDGFGREFPLTVTIAPELPHAEELTRACRECGILVNVGHSYATFEQVEAAIGWGARHVDHLFCAMSDRARLRQTQLSPMRAGVMEASLFFEELTTEVIADGKHLNDPLLRFASRMKGPERLALVTDSMRAVDLPDGEYWFGREGSGERIRRLNDVGVTLDGVGLASGVMGMDHLVRTMLRATGAPLQDVVRMASLTPATILGLDSELGSIAPGKSADLVVMDREFNVVQVFVGGKRVA